MHFFSRRQLTTGSAIRLRRKRRRRPLLLRRQLAKAAHHADLNEKLESRDDTIREIVELTTNQCGFGYGCSTTDAIHAPRLPLERHREKRRPKPAPWTLLKADDVVLASEDKSKLK
uniref:Uncharacterized protein n=1 Tax=Haemonchus contortus TaxID=6289 RepID=A0A7I5EB45_HAECO